MIFVRFKMFLLETTPETVEIAIVETQISGNIYKYIINTCW